MGLIGGGPTFLGTAVGHQFTSDAMSVVFLTLAAGSILYVVIQLLGVALKSGRKELLYWGVLLGLVGRVRHRHGRHRRRRVRNISHFRVDSAQPGIRRADGHHRPVAGAGVPVACL